MSVFVLSHRTHADKNNSRKELRCYGRWRGYGAAYCLELFLRGLQNQLQPALRQRNLRIRKYRLQTNR